MHNEPIGMCHACYSSVIGKTSGTLKYMKKIIVISGAALFLAAGTSLWADDTGITYKQDPDEMYRASEISLGAFGMGTVNEHTLNEFTGENVKNHGRVGAGGDLEYFITRYIGVEAEAWTENTEHSFVDDVGGNLVGRIPISDTGLAPYVFGGAGHSFDPVVATYGDVGAGLEFRFRHNFGIFVDGRYVIPDRLGNYGMGRAGVRFAF